MTLWQTFSLPLVSFGDTVPYPAPKSGTYYLNVPKQQGSQNLVHARATFGRKKAAVGRSRGHIPSDSLSECFLIVVTFDPSFSLMKHTSGQFHQHFCANFLCAKFDAFFDEHRLANGAQIWQTLNLILAFNFVGEIERRVLGELIKQFCRTLRVLKLIFHQNGLSQINFQHKLT